ncbi:MAG TPA: metallophosphoesterase family protein [Streptosporangiaceae bacterium]|nr:metallophosphoesterase family protein [Streptosporangiaceae bacterium]
MPTQQELTAAEAVAGETKVSARRIGLIGDDHNARPDGADLPAEVLRAFDGVDLIIHLGHMGFREILARGVLDRLGKVAPVLAVRDYSTDSDGDTFVTPADGDRVAGLTRVVNADGVRIGVVHNLARPPGQEIPTPPGGLPDLTGVDVPTALTEKFGGPVDVVAYASSHRAAAVAAQGVLFVNPGSPTYPKAPWRPTGKKLLGTVGILDLTGGAAAFETIELSLPR